MKNFLLWATMFFLASCTQAHPSEQEYKQLNKINILFYAEDSSQPMSVSEIEDKQNVIAEETFNFLIKYPEDKVALGNMVRMYIYLNNWEQALVFIKKLNAIQQDGVMKFSECLLIEKTSLMEPLNCYKESTDIFKDSLNNSDEDMNYLLATFMSGDQEAINMMLVLANTSEDELERDIAKSFAEGLLKNSRMDVVNILLKSRSD